MTRKDQLVRATDLDALSCRRSANEKGYFNPPDPYISPLVTAYDSCLQYCDGYTQYSANKTLRHAFRDLKYPLINRGTFYRTQSVDRLVSGFIAEHSKCQIVALGGGSDTRAFRVLGTKAAEHVTYAELDFPEQTRVKRMAISNSPLLQKAIGWTMGETSIIGSETGSERRSGAETRSEVEGRSGAVSAVQGATGNITGAEFRELPSDLHIDRYHLVGIDLRGLSGSPPDSLSFLDPRTPTLLLSECVLCYLTPDENVRVLEFWRQCLDHVSIAMYDPMGLNDAFGRTMAENLAQRGLDLGSFVQYPDLASRKAFFKTLGFRPYLTDLASVGGYGDPELAWIPASEWSRVSRLEMIDEVEEISMLLKHYCLIYAEHNISSQFVEKLKWHDV